MVLELIYVEPDDHIKEFDPLTVLYINCYENVREIVKQRTGHYPRKYKKLEIQHIDKFLHNIPYKGRNYVDFVSNMMSGLIVIHGLSNTNHRTTMLFTSMILNELGIDFPNYDSVRERERWIGECNSFIKGSKRILSKRKEGNDYTIKHQKWTREWLMSVTDRQSMSSGMMSFHLLSSLRKIPSSEGLSLSVIS